MWSWLVEALVGGGRGEAATPALGRTRLDEDIDDIGSDLDF